MWSRRRRVLPRNNSEWNKDDLTYLSIRNYSNINAIAIYFLEICIFKINAFLTHHFLLFFIHALFSL